MSEWPYLAGEAFQTRCAIAAYWLRDCDTIVELGGYVTPISDFVSDKPVVVMDEKIKAFDDGMVKHIPKYFPQDNLQLIGKYGVLVLGLELHMDKEGWQKFFDLINGSHKTVLGVAMDYIHSTDQLKLILKSVKKRIKIQVSMDMRQEEKPEKRNPPYYRRKLFLLD